MQSIPIPLVLNYFFKPICPSDHLYCLKSSFSFNPPFYSLFWISVLSVTFILQLHDFMSAFCIDACLFLTSPLLCQLLSIFSWWTYFSSEKKVCLNLVTLKIPHHEKHKEKNILLHELLLCAPSYFLFPFREKLNFSAVITLLLFLFLVSGLNIWMLISKAE